MGTGARCLILDSPVLPSVCADVCSWAAPQCAHVDTLRVSPRPRAPATLSRTGRPADGSSCPLCVTPVREHLASMVQNPVFPDVLPSSHPSWVCCLTGVPARNQGTGGPATHNSPSALSPFFLGAWRIFLTGGSSPYTSTSLNILSGTSWVLLTV